MIVLNKDKNKDFKILNITDTQVADNELKEARYLEVFESTLRELVKRTEPDLITMTGDIAYADQTIPYRIYGHLLDSFKIPWTLVFGNHDNEGDEEHKKQTVEILRGFENFVFEEGDPRFGCGNFVISVEEEKKPIFSLVMVDSHNRDRHEEADGEVWYDWAKLQPDHIQWIDDTLAEIESRGCPESVVMLHIPIYSYRYAADAAFAGGRGDLAASEKPEFWNEGYKDSVGVMREDICSSWTDEKALEMLTTHPSAKYIICGHDHVNNFMITYKGVRHIYALKTGIGSYYDGDLNGGTLITLGEGVDIHHEYVAIN